MKEEDQESLESEKNNDTGHDRFAGLHEQKAAGQETPVLTPRLPQGGVPAMRRKRRHTSQGRAKEAGLGM